MRSLSASWGASLAQAFAVLTALSLSTSATAASFEEAAAVILGGLKDGAVHRVDPSLVLKRIREHPPSFEFTDPKPSGSAAVITVTAAGHCRARMTAYVREVPTRQWSVRSTLLFDFGKATELEVILGRDEMGEPIPSVHFAGRSGVCSSRGPGAACELGLLRHGFRSTLEELREAVGEMTRVHCPI